MEKKVLFLCTGNYYRSRFAEILFEYQAKRLGLNWKSESRGLRVGNPENIGMVSIYCLKGLTKRGIYYDPERFPLQCLKTDLINADLIIALKQEEHEPMAKILFPELAQKILYWNIHDIDIEFFENALDKLEVLINILIDKLHKELLK